MAGGVFDSGGYPGWAGVSILTFDLLSLLPLFIPSLLSVGNDAVNTPATHHVRQPTMLFAVFLRTLVMIIVLVVMIVVGLDHFMQGGRISIPRKRGDHPTWCLRWDTLA